MALFYIDGRTIDDSWDGFYAASNGTQYPYSWGASIPGSHVVAMVARPTPTPAQTVGDYAVEVVDGVPTQVWPITTLSLADAQAAMVQKISDLNEAKQNGGTTINGMFINTNARGLSLAQGAINRLTGDGAPETVGFWVEGTTFVDMNLAQVQAVYDAISDFIQACYDSARGLVTAVMALTDADAAMSYDILQGWP